MMRVALGVRPPHGRRHSTLSRTLRAALCLASNAIIAMSTLLVHAASNDGAAPRVVPWTPAGVSNPMFESHAAFDPLNGDFWFVRSAPEFKGWYLLMSRCGKAGWLTQERPSFAAVGLEADPWFTPDGRSLYFISNRSTDGIHRMDLDIWKVDRDASGTWGMPMRLPAPVNSEGNEWFPRIAADGWLYFGSNRQGNIGNTDIHRAKSDSDGRWLVENLGPNINRAGNQYEAALSPDGKRMVIATDIGLHESWFVDGAWTPRAKLPAPIHVDGSEIGALFSPSGKSLLFSQHTKGPLSGEFFVWRIEGDEDWPPRCPRP